MNRDIIKIQSAIADDIEPMVQLSAIKRQSYEKIQPIFWHRAEDADKHQAMWFLQLLTRTDYLILTAKQNNNMLGFIVGQVVHAPGVYDPGGLTLIIDDFCVIDNDWKHTGFSLIYEIQQLAKDRGAMQIVVVCGAHDLTKRKFLKKHGLNIVSEWHVGKIQ